jgi:hypothetical protein
MPSGESGRTALFPSAVANKLVCEVPEITKAKCATAAAKSCPASSAACRAWPQARRCVLDPRGFCRSRLVRARGGRPRRRANARNDVAPSHPQYPEAANRTFYHARRYKRTGLALSDRGSLWFASGRRLTTARPPFAQSHRDRMHGDDIAKLVAQRERHARARA